MTADRKDLLTGVVFIGCGGYFALNALNNLDIGTTFQMGPGYFPMILGGVLALLGVLLVVRSLGKVGQSLGEVSWRAVVLVAIAPILFGFTVRGLGFVAATGLTVFFSSFASRHMTIPFALSVTAVLTAFCTGVFVFALGLPLKLVGSWLGG